MAKADSYRGRRKVKDHLEEELYKVEHRNAEGCPFLPHEKPTDWMLTSPPLKLTFSHCSNRGDSFLYGCAGQAGQVHHHHLKEQTVKVHMVMLIVSSKDVCIF